MRGRLPVELQRSWTQLQWVRDQCRSEEDRALVTVAGSLSRSGYDREQAVRAMGQCPFQFVGPYLLLRCHDWVPHVRTIAREELRGAMTLNSVELLAPFIALIVARARDERTQKFFDELRQELLSGDALLPVLRSLDRTSARIALEVLLPVRGIAIADQLDLKRSPAALTVIRHGQANGDDVNELARRCLTSSDPLTAATVLLHVIKQQPDDLASILEEAAFHSSSMVRSLAYAGLRELGIDSAALFRAAVKSNTVAALRGLTEVGVKEDVAIALPLVESSVTKRRRAAVQVIVRYAPAEYHNLLLRLTIDDATRVARAAHGGLVKLGLTHEVVAKLYAGLVEKDPEVFERRFFGWTLSNSSRWIALEFSIKGLADGDTIESLYAAAALERVLVRWEMSGEGPPAGLAERLIGEVAAIRDHPYRELSDAEVDRVIETIRPWLSRAV